MEIRQQFLVWASLMLDAVAPTKDKKTIVGRVSSHHRTFVRFACGISHSETCHILHTTCSAARARGSCLCIHCSLMDFPCAQQRSSRGDVMCGGG